MVMNGGHSGYNAGMRVPAAAPKHIGVRALRDEYLRPTHRHLIPKHMSMIEDYLKRSHLSEQLVSDARGSLPRFKHLFPGDELFPEAVFLAALDLGRTERRKGMDLPFDADVLLLRDDLLIAYKPLVAKLRQVLAREIDVFPSGLLSGFVRSWVRWEGAWLSNREVHAVEALQPLAKAILSLEPLLLSHNKEKLLPWPRVQHQKVVTLKCLEGFVHALSDLAASMLPSLQRELDHDPRLLLLMDHVLKLRGEMDVNSCLTGLSTTPDVSFPDRGNEEPSQEPLSPTSGARLQNRELPLDAYAFKLLGTSRKEDQAGGRSPLTKGLDDNSAPLGPGGVSKETSVAKRAASHATELLTAFENVKDVLLSLKSTLEYVDASLDQDTKLLEHLQRFERAFRRSKRLFLEPDNLA